MWPILPEVGLGGIIRVPAEDLAYDNARLGVASVRGGAEEAFFVLFLGECRDDTLYVVNLERGSVARFVSLVPGPPRREHRLGEGFPRAAQPYAPDVR